MEVSAVQSQGPSCGTNSSTQAPCTFATLTNLQGSMAGIETTFVEVGSGDVVNGVATVHLRSQSGMVMPTYGPIPGTTDLWIARDGGYLVRETFDGQRIATTVDITNVNDPANVVQRPAEGPATPTPVPYVTPPTAPGSLAWQVSQPFGSQSAPLHLLGGSKGFVAMPELYDEGMPDLPWRSRDGLSWRQLAADLAFKGTQFSAMVERPDGSLLLIGRVVGCSPDPCGPPDVGGHVWTSDDWETWIKQPLSDPLASFWPDDLSFGPHGYVAVGRLDNGGPVLGPPAILTSPDGVSWTVAGRFDNFDSLVVADQVDEIVVVGEQHDLDTGARRLVALISSDARTWTEHLVGQAVDCCTVNDLIATADGFLLVGDHDNNDVPLAMTSADGSVWKQVNQTPSLKAADIRSVVQVGGRLLAGGMQNGAAAAWSSLDGGRTWQAEGAFALQARGSFGSFAVSPAGIVAFTEDSPARDDASLTSRAWFAPLP